MFQIQLDFWLNEGLVKRLSKFLSNNVSLFIVIEIVFNIEEPVLIARSFFLKEHQNFDFSETLIDKVFLLLNHLSNHFRLVSIILKDTVMDIREGAFG